MNPTNRQLHQKINLEMRSAFVLINFVKSLTQSLTEIYFISVSLTKFMYSQDTNQEVNKADDDWEGAFDWDDNASYSPGKVKDLLGDLFS